MKRIDITAYDVTIKTPEGDKQIPYKVKESIVGLLFHPDAKIDAREAVIRDRLATKIENCPDQIIFLEEADYNKINAAIDLVKTFTRNDVTFIQRIREAETVDPQTALEKRGLITEK